MGTALTAGTSKTAPKRASKPVNKPATKSTTTPTRGSAVKTAGKTGAPARKAVAARQAAPAKKAQKASVSAAAKAKTAAAAPQREKPKHKLVRDSFTMPQSDFDLIAVLKKRVMALGRSAKKSELLRAGLHALTRLDDAALHGSLQALIQLKAGRPRKQG